MAWARDRDTDDEDEGSTRRQHRAFQPARVAFRRTRPIRNQYLQGYVLQAIYFFWVSYSTKNQPIATRQNLGPDQIESICRQQIKCNKNDYFCL